MAMLTLRRRNRRKLETREWRLPAIPWRRVITVGGFFLLAIAVGYGLILAVDQPIRVVSIEGRFQRVSPVQVEQLVTHSLDAGFMSVNLAAVREKVEALPWVEQAQVRRRWPDGLRIEITEQVAAARWGDAGLLNTRGELFIRDARHMPPELPRLSGPEGTQVEVAQRYLSAQGRLIEAGARMTALDLDARGAWQLELSNGISVRLGRRDVEQRLDRFIETTLPLMATRAQDIAYIDMRYSSGFAVGWKPGANRPTALASGDAPVRQPPKKPARRSTA